jgi:tetratricopeptide (TPR) repeat protein
MWTGWLALVAAPSPGATASGSATPRGAPAAERAALRERARILLERRELARRDGGIPLDPLQRDLRALADSLADARLDSLAAMVRYRAAGVLSRLERRDEAERQLTLSIADALRARSVRDELAARALLVDWRSDRDPDDGLVAARALLRRQEALGNLVGQGEALASLARSSGRVGRWPESLAYARRAAAVLDRGRNTRLQVFALTQCSQALRFLGRHPEALAFADSAIRLGRRDRSGAPLARALLERATILRTLGRLDDGLASASEALALDRRLGDLRHETTSRLFRTSLLYDAGRFHEMLLESDSLRLPGHEDPVVDVRAAGARGLALVELGRLAEADTLLDRALSRFEKSLASIDRDEDRAGALDHASVAHDTWARCRLRLAGPEAGLRALERSGALESRRRLGGGAPLDPAVLHGHLRATRAALIVYSEGLAGTGFACILADGELRAVEIPPGKTREDARTAMVFLESGHLDRPARAALERIAARWVHPVARSLPAGIERLAIVPPSALASFPFEVLSVAPTDPAAGEGGLGASAVAPARVGERWAVSYLPAAAALLTLAARTPGRGVVSFADAPAQGLPGLRASRVEARAMAGSHGTLVIGAAATGRRFDALVRDCGVMHVATHAVVDPIRPGSSGLRLAGPDGLVTAARIESLSTNADLVVLSGCRTARGAIHGREGAFGLARAFLVAGARSVVTTLWDVEDRNAARVVAAFGDALRQGLPRDEALRRGRRALDGVRNAARDRWAFVLIGTGGDPVNALRGGRSGGPGK